MSDEATNVLRQALAATQSTDAAQRKQGVCFLRKYRWCFVLWYNRGGVPESYVGLD